MTESEMRQLKKILDDNEAIIEGDRMLKASITSLVEKAWPEYRRISDKGQYAAMEKKDHEAYANVFRTAAYQIFVASNVVKDDDHESILLIAEMQSRAFQLALELGAWMYATGRLELKEQK